MDPIEGISSIERQLVSAARRKRIPAVTSIELLPLCNMNCDMCYVRMSAEEMKKAGRMHTADEWLEVVRQMRENGVLFLLLTGGEPLIFPDFKRLYLEIQKMGFVVTVNTNGTLLDEDWAEFFGKNKPRRVNISLYGADDNNYEKLCHYPGGFSKVINGIQMLRQRNVDVKISISVAKQNYEDTERIIDIAEKLGVPVSVDTYMMPTTRERNIPYNMQARLDPEKAALVRFKTFRKLMGEEEFARYASDCVRTMREYEKENLEETPEHITCYAGTGSFAINWQGNMTPCIILSEPKFNVFDMGVADAWKKTVASCEEIVYYSGCSVCKYRRVCRTCAACCKTETGSYTEKPEYMCSYAKEYMRMLESYVGT